MTPKAIARIQAELFKIYEDPDTAQGITTVLFNK